MKKRIIALLLIFIVFSSVLLGVWIRLLEFNDSPGGEYQIVSWIIDVGGWGYRGAYYVKEKGLFSKWHKLGTGPFIGEWLSETEFFIRHSNPIDGDYKNSAKDNYYREYHVDEFFGQ